MTTRHHCIVIRDYSNGAESDWKVIHYQFEQLADYEHFVRQGKLPPEEDPEKTWGWKPVPVPTGHVTDPLILSSETKAEAVRAAFVALDFTNSTVHDYEPLDDGVPVFVEEPGGQLLQAIRPPHETLADHIRNGRTLNIVEDDQLIGHTVGVLVKANLFVSPEQRETLKSMNDANRDEITKALRIVRAPSLNAYLDCPGKLS